MINGVEHHFMCLLAFVNISCLLKTTLLDCLFHFNDCILMIA